MSDFVIEKGQPMPPGLHRGPRTKGRPKGPKYPWDKMEVGDRIKIPVMSWANPNHIRQSVATSARLWSKGNGLEHLWSTRSIDGELYIYRVA
jgi:hypothetical protein